MKKFCQAFIIFLSCWDTLATQHIVGASLAGEGNPLMSFVIANLGWIFVWGYKIGLAIIVAKFIPIFWPKLWGKMLVISVFVTYVSAALVHLFIFAI